MTIQEKRAHLRELSNQAQEIREKLLHQCNGDAEIHAVNAMTVNQILIKYIYTSEQHTTFHTFKGWIKEGFCVRKGQTAFLVWGRPKDVQKEEKAKAQGKKPAKDEEDDDTFYPVSFIFSNAQVRELEKKED